jgi:hypothetical protein
MPTAKPRFVTAAAGAVAAVLIVGGCGPKGGDSSGSQPGDSVTSGLGKVAGATPGRPAQASLPDRLPKFTSADTTEQAMRTIIGMAIAYALDTPDADRHPQVAATSEFICGVRQAAAACPPTTADAKVVIYIDPQTAWQQFQEPIGHGGGDTVMQDRVVASAMNYLFFRDMQRGHPDLLTTTSTAKAAQIRGVQLCVEGRVVGGLHNHHVMSGELEAMYSASYRHPEFTKGMQGGC